MSARADRALRAAAGLAAAPEGRVSAGRLAQAQDIPGTLLETILARLRRANIVRLQRGPDGGYWLARPAAEISLADIVRAVDGQAPGARPGPAGPLRRVRAALDANEQAVLQAVTLADIGQDGGDLDWLRHRPRRPPAGGARPPKGEVRPSPGCLPRPATGRAAARWAGGWRKGRSCS